eukprot:CAMPEP_0117651252 /NCGR_PEP_ID=MMETSP0804-20121206/1991_1 /TAXON_ID=1074897 /ORGANISM="Tetraselmis astigmatica, Strain CCMP880" /LENGTH=95 /DNA_ID=CAMNT_0005457213 /DNA_START=779 /DNA_END=1066 /DNA_ORIENTATION=+
MEHDENADAKGPNVGCSGSHSRQLGSPGNLLPETATVLQRGTPVAKPIRRHSALLHSCCHPKIDDSRLAVGANEEVVGLDVQMVYAIGVEIVHSP